MEHYFYEAFQDQDVYHDFVADFDGQQIVHHFKQINHHSLKIVHHSQQQIGHHFDQIAHHSP